MFPKHGFAARLWFLQRRQTRQIKTKLFELLLCGLVWQQRLANHSLFHQRKHTVLKPGAKKETSQQKMKRLGAAWGKLSQTQKDAYKEKNLAEFEAQRAALDRRGCKVRGSLPQKPDGNVETPEEQISIGPYKIRLHGTKQERTRPLWQNRFRLQCLRSISCCEGLQWARRAGGGCL